MSSYDKKFFSLVFAMISIPTFGPIVCHIIKFS
jgi:hypothetical protein